MKYALVDGVRRDAEPGLNGTCPNCDREMIAKCGQRRIWHWSHRGKLECDRWWEPETEWHRAWKALFPHEWQEVIHVGANDERHIADVKSDRGLVVEFQHSPIAPEERLSRESFYQPMAWVVDGMRYKRDLASFSRAVTFGDMLSEKPLLVSSPLMATAAVFQRWAPHQHPVFVDFGDVEFSIAGLRCPEPVLWQLLSIRETGLPIVSAVTRASFLQFVLSGSELQRLEVTRPPMPRTSRYKLVRGFAFPNRIPRHPRTRRR